ncbi:MAG TPA: DUF4384 domain-containing protein [Pyrinomonadaceae bacterium]|nr:DUF4384 domain-containing protein [Pyrinomonadaceae bacterium]
MTRIFLLILAISLPLVAHPQQPKDRSITSDDFNKSRPSLKRRSIPRQKTYRLASPPLAKRLDVDSASTLKVGVTLWKVHREGYGRESREVATRVEAGTEFHDGDFIRISIESPRPGYLYVIDRDWFTDGSPGGETNLIFPHRGEDNRLEAGKLIDIPAQAYDPFKATPKANQAGEMLTIIVTSLPLSLSLSDDPLPVSSTQLAAWEGKWSGMTERFEMNGGVGQTRTIAEQEATGMRQLTRDDPSPQTIYFLVPRSGDGLLFNLLLSYVR